MTKSETKRLDDANVLLSILDHLPTSIFVKDEALRFVYSNALHCEIIGKTEEELLGHSDAEFWPAEEAMQFLRNDRDVIESGSVSIKEETATRSDGQVFPLMTRKARLTTPDGKTYLIGTNSDVSELKRRENKYRALTDTLPVAVCQVEEGGTVSFTNPRFKTYCGDDASVAEQTAVVATLSGFYAGFPGVICKFEADLTDAKGQARRVIAMSSGWITIEQGVRSAIISLVDITEMSELRRINEEVTRLNCELAANMKKLSEAQDELLKKGRMEQLGQLTATIAHELRNPLGSVRTSSFLLDRKLRGKELGIEQQLERINKGILRCDNIITQLLDFSRTKQLNCSAGDLDAWLGQVLSEEAQKLPAHVTIKCELGLDGLSVPFDPARMQRAVINLLSNACEAMAGQDEGATKEAPRTAEITVTTESVKGFAVITVRDTGPGIPEEVMARIREPLFTTKSFGTGLGVPAIEQTLALHGGHLEITSAPREGATFKLFLPMDLTGKAAA